MSFGKEGSIREVSRRRSCLEGGAKHSQTSDQTLEISKLPTTMAPFDLDACIQKLLRKQLLHEALLREICEKTKEVLMRESNVVHVSAPVTVVGDIHG